MPAVYDFEYELESTRGRKRILSTGAPACQKVGEDNGAGLSDSQRGQYGAAGWHGP